MQVHSWANRKTDFLSWMCALTTLWGGLTTTPYAVADPAEKVLYTFNEPGDGINPIGPLTGDRLGNLYGVARGRREVIFQLTPPAQGIGAWTETVLHRFPDCCASAGLIADAKGNLYGTISGGGTAFGTVFELSPPVPGHTQWTETVLYNFTGGNDGDTPSGGLIADRQGNLYGTTTWGGEPEAGVVYELTGTGFAP